MLDKLYNNQYNIIFNYTGTCMSTFYKIVLSIVVIFAQLFFIAPWLVSQPSDTTVITGFVDLVLLIPQGWYLGKWIGLTFDKEQ